MAEQRREKDASAVATPAQGSETAHEAEAGDAPQVVRDRAAAARARAEAALDRAAAAKERAAATRERAEAARERAAAARERADVARQWAEVSERDASGKGVAPDVSAAPQMGGPAGDGCAEDSDKAGSASSAEPTTEHGSWPARALGFVRTHAERITLVTTLVKVAACLSLACLAHTYAQDDSYLLFALLELAVVFLAPMAVMTRLPRAGQLLNAVLVLLWAVQLVVMVFANTYVSLVMLTNLDSVEDLAGRASTYIASAVLALVVCALPVRPLRLRHVRPAGLLSGVLAVELVLAMTLGGGFSPLYAYIDVALQWREAADYQRELSGQPDQTAYFYSAVVRDFRARPDALPERPNVVLILTEGLSQNVIDDSRSIMPNVADYQARSLSFTNYYNHTFATYRGIIGQLYSGYQLDNLDTNTLVSLQQILSDNGYHTSFVNAEPNNLQFTSYLNALGFDELVSDASGDYNGAAHSLADGEAYDALFETIEREGRQDTPFFTAMYTFGTHVSLDSPEERYDDGADSVLNRFYNADYQFGRFMRRLGRSALANNTVVIYTTDHATYADRYYTDAFPDYERPLASLDEIPLFIYYPGIEAEEIDVQGRNSLDLAPTVLDLLDLTGPNYFLGLSLFAPIESANSYHTVFGVSHELYGTAGGVIAHLGTAERDLLEPNLRRYYVAKTQPPVVPTGDEQTDFGSMGNALAGGTRKALTLLHTRVASASQAHQGP